ncbi:hypothetical protein R3W88_033395 [Solanum pinnatisectum]|uniref:Gag-pol polyprotein n=1 Tax=Solanum pinnatisectum TaxID=50273 RepID=A0AAV9K148_9SOLN|nr:hypothetical protein R3W88_033395 [Solanum pinnatisectum]
MNTRGRPARRVGEKNVNEGVPPQGTQDVQVPVKVPDMMNQEIMPAFLILARAMAAQATRNVRPRVNANEGTKASKLKEFMRMNPLVFLGSKVGEDPQEFLDELPVGVDPIEWEEFKEALLGRFNKRAPNKDSSGAPKVNQEKGGGSQFSKPSCTTCGNRHYGKCLAGTNGCYGYGKNYHKVKDCPTLTARGREAKQASKDGTVPIPPNFCHFYALQDNKDKEANPDESTGK